VRRLAIPSILMFLMLGLSIIIPVHASLTSATLTEWTVPTRGSGPLGLTLDPSGHCCWFVEYFGNKVGHFDPKKNTFQEWSIPTPAANPNSLAATEISGSLVLWGTESGTDKIFSFSPHSGLFYEYNLTNQNLGVLGVGSISTEPSTTQARLWFTEAFNNTNEEFVYDSTTGNVTLYEDQFPAAVGGGAYGVYASSGSVWYAGFSALVKWDRASSRYTIWRLPIHGPALARSVVLDENGRAWYTQGATDALSGDNFVGLLSGNGTIDEWRMPNPGSDPRGISIDPLTQRPWIAEASPIAGNGTIATLNPFGGETVISVNATTAPSEQARETILSTGNLASFTNNVVVPAERQMFGIPSEQFTNYQVGATQPKEALVDSAGNIWFSEPGTNKIAELSRAPDFALRVTPLTLSLVQGNSGIVSVTVASISGYTGKAMLMTTSSAQGVTLSSFNTNPLSISPGSSASAQFTIDVAYNAPNVTSTILIEGTGGNTTHQVTITLTVTNSSNLTQTTTPSRCLIATATYGSDLSPEVQLLRSFRDNALEKSEVGSAFLVVFNAWYYSFSPIVAGYLRDSVPARTLMKGILYPLIAFLFLASTLYWRLSVYPELATALSGLLAIALTGSLYLGLPLGLLARRSRRPLCYLNVKVFITIFLGGISSVMIGLILSSSILLKIASSISVLSALFVSAMLTITAICSVGRMDHSNGLRHLSPASSTPVDISSEEYSRKANS